MDTAERLFATYHATLVRYLTRRLGDRDWAEDVAQETFVRALRQETIVNERAWVFAVAHNLVRDGARRDERNRRHLELMAAEARDAEPDAPDDEQSPERAERLRLARQALAALSERDRQALLLKEEGLDYEEIAAVLEIEKSSVGTTLSRARRRLAESYEELTATGRGGADVAS
ncbi:MAG TPA: sigma-70 family RNA polymerase sigma factor [Gemmatimonadaceae bacterium]|nr:sigma-70 family RNA polymerase sigma factor [Gemmatimonadaceae bacterium]HRQ77074.1 sigma-70 family RNA polymerase sigma factor [Gemmatimonadaceae bacterium]